MNRKKIVFLGGMAFLFLFFVVFVAQQESILRSESTIILETRPVDPRDLFKGEYVILSYAIETNELVREVSEKLDEGDDIYVLLEKDVNGIGSVSRVETTRPSDLDDYWIRGEVKKYNRIEFSSISQYYVPEGAGLPIERMRNKLHVRVALKDSEARVIELLDEDLNVINPFDYLPSDPIKSN